MIRAVTGILLIALTGCAYLHSTTTRTPIPNVFSNYGTNQTGVAIYPMQEVTTIRVYTLFDGQANLTKFNNRSGYTTNGVFGPGTYISNLNEASTTSNLVDIIGAVAAGVVRGMKP